MMMRDHATGPDRWLGVPPDSIGPGTPPGLRLVVALGDAERERRLLPTLSESGVFIIARRCLSAEEVLGCARDGTGDVALLSDDVHRLTRGVLLELGQTRLPVVLLTTGTHGDLWSDLPVRIIRMDADSLTVENALLEATRDPRRTVIPPVEQQPSGVPSRNESDAASGRHWVIAVASGHGAPGRTTVALNLAAALGATASTLLVDLDLDAPSVVAFLDADPTRNVAMLAYNQPMTDPEWDSALAQEVQQCSPRSPDGFVLGGVPKPGMRGALSTAFVEGLITVLRARYRYLILDVGADLVGTEAAVHRLALGLADRVLLVTAADFVALDRARVALGALRNEVRIDPARLALVVNRHHHRFHHGPSEIGWALGVPVAAVIPHDYTSVERSLAAQRPLVGDRRSSAGRSLVDLAQRIHGGRIILPPEPSRPSGAHWLPRLAVTGLGLLGARLPGRRVPPSIKGVGPKGDHDGLDVSLVG